MCRPALVKPKSPVEGYLRARLPALLKSNPNQMFDFLRPSPIPWAVAKRTRMTKETVLLKIDPGKIDHPQIKTAVDVMEREGIMVYPTETFYGLGALATSERAVRGVYELKRREPAKPLPVVVSDLAMAEGIAASVPDVFRRLAGEFWPGPLTLILKAKPLFPALMLGPGGSIGMRIPKSPWLIELVGRLRAPITATSANISGDGAICEPAEMIALFGGKVDLIVDGGKTPGSLSSTILDLTGEKPRLVRAGAIPVSALAEYL